MVAAMATRRPIRIAGPNCRVRAKLQRAMPTPTNRAPSDHCRLLGWIVPQTICGDFQMLRPDFFCFVQKGECPHYADRLHLTAVPRLHAFLGQIAQHGLQCLARFFTPGKS